MARMRIKYDDAVIRGRLTALEQRLPMAVDAVIQYHALKGMGYLKTDAPWTDRTGAARAGLHTSVAGYTRDAATGRFARAGSSQKVITFAHAVNYGIWLEVKYSGRDAVIMPTVLKTGGELMISLQRVLDSL